MDQIIIYIIVGIAGLITAQWKKIQARKAEQEYQRQRQQDAAPTAAATTPGTAAYDANRRYQEIQDEIRRRIAQRANLPMPAPTSTAQPAQARPIQPVLVPYESRRESRPQSAPPPLARPQPVAQPLPAVVSTPAVASPSAVASAFAMPTGDLPSTMADVWKQNTSNISDEARAYSTAATQESTSMSALRAALASASSARRAFILREVLDRPLCARPLCSGGHDNWN